ncbi:hypothetical protein MLD38_029971 [Melastoma candidum]|uniref:Uncharacterized protein n=1 Tax=Melastoma candidum TaxID=119954 RepID=A0ACB9MM50_9MYRT|nr:hypothetical protein MLD38_029971 [Melastoma candidum]
MSTRYSLKRGNRFLRKNRKWPLPSYYSRWHLALRQEEALQSLKTAAKSYPIPDAVSTLLDSFSSHDCDPTPQSYGFLLNLLCSTGQYRQIPPLLDRLEKVEAFEVPEFVFRQLISSYGGMGRVDDAIDLFYRIPRFRCVPTVHSLNALLFMLCSKGESARMVPAVLSKCREMGVRVDESSFRVLIGALCRFRKVGWAVEVVRIVVGEGFGVDVETCSRILSYWSDQGAVDRAGIGILGFVEEMRKIGFCPEVVDYANVIKFLMRNEKVSDAYNVLNQMKDEGVWPNVACYTMIMSGLIKEDEFEKADELFDELLVSGMVPDVSAYNVYIMSLCKRDDIEAAIEVASGMGELGCHPNEATYLIIFERLIKAGNLSRAEMLLKEIQAKGIQLNRRNYQFLIDSFLAVSEVKEVVDLPDGLLDKLVNTSL